MALSCSIVTTCKGRLRHLQLSLPTFVAQPDAEVVVVDYDCPDATGAWVRTHFPAARVERVAHAPIFNVSRARNIGARAARAPWLVFCDADNVLSDAFTPALAAYVAPGVFARPYRDTGHCAIAVPFPLACEAHVFWEVGGFDDAIEGWGAEDWEFVERLLRHGVAQRVFPESLVRILDHDDSARTRFYEDAMQVSRLISHYYAQIKARYSETRGRWFTDEQRYAVYRQVKDAVHAALGGAALEALFDVRVPGADPPWTARLRAAEVRAIHARIAPAATTG